jgi:hypothetical protein
MKNEMRDKTPRPGGGPTDEIFAQLVEKQVRLAKLLTVAALFFAKVRENWTRAHPLFIPLLLLEFRPEHTASGPQST